MLLPSHTKDRQARIRRVLGARNICVDRCRPGYLCGKSNPCAAENVLSDRAGMNTDEPTSYLLEGLDNVEIGVRDNPGLAGSPPVQQPFG